jgi:putative spermidine/putrescine transport system substrate-binding protein
VAITRSKPPISRPASPYLPPRGRVVARGQPLKIPAPLLSLAALLLVPAGCAPGDTPLTLEQLAELATAEDDVVYTYGMPDDYGGYRVAFQRFEERHGIRRLDLSMSSTAVLERLAEERDDPQTDAVVVGALRAHEAVEQELVDCVPLGAAADYPPEHVGRGEDGCVQWIDTFTGTLGFMVNLEVVDQPPRTWSELLQPDIARQVTFLDPRASATGIATLLAAARAMGGSAEDPSPGAELLVAIAEAGGADPMLQRQDYDGFLRGTRPILINYDYNERQLKERYDIEVEFVVPLDGTVSMPYSTLLVRDRPHPHGGQLLMEYLHGQPGQGALDEGGVTPLRPGAAGSRSAAKDSTVPAGVEVWEIQRDEVGPQLDAIRRAFDREVARLERARP